MADGTRRPGGSAFYSALQAARLGARALILTRGVPGEIESLLEPSPSEFELRGPAGRRRRPRWQTAGVGRPAASGCCAGPGRSSSRHAPRHRDPAPGARRRRALRAAGGAAGFLGPDAAGACPPVGELGRMCCRPSPAPMPSRCAAGAATRWCSAEHERATCAGLIERAHAGGAIVAITDGPGPNVLTLPDGEVLQLPVAPIEGPADDLGAGDVFAGAFFLALAEGCDPALRPPRFAQRRRGRAGMGGRRRRTRSAPAPRCGRVFASELEPEARARARPLGDERRLDQPA